MNILHTVNKSPFTHSALIDCLEICSKDDIVILIEDGVIGIMPQAAHSEKIDRAIRNGTKIYALETDIKARGLQPYLSETIDTANYEKFVELCTKCTSIQSWY